MFGKMPRSAASRARGGRGLGPEEGGDLVGQGQGLGRVVPDLHHDEQVGPAHDPEPDAAVALGHLLDLRQGVFVDVDDVVQEADGRGDDAGEAVPVEAVLGAAGSKKLARLIEPRLQDS